MSQKNKNKKRRGNGEGSIRQEPNGRWVGQYIVGYKDDGKPIRKTKRADTKKEVMAWMDKLKHEVLTTGYKRSTENDNFEILHWRWFDWWAKNKKGLNRRNRVYRSKKLVGFFGTSKITEVTQEMVEAFVEQELKRVTKKETHLTRRQLDHFFDWCQNEGYIVKHPSKFVEIGEGNNSRKQTASRQALTDEEIGRIQKVLDEQATPRERAIMTMLLYLGVRPGELRAAKWEHFKDGYLHIQEAMKIMVDFEEDGRTVKRQYEEVGDPKCSTPDNLRDRYIPVDPVSQKVLDEWQAEQERSGLANPHGLLFPKIKGDVGGYYVHQGMLQETQKFFKKYGLEDIRRCPYGFRHTYGTSLSRKNIPSIHIAEAMGHSDITTTHQYYIDTQKKDPTTKKAILTGLAKIHETEDERCNAGAVVVAV